MSKYRIYKKHFIEDLNHLANYDLQKLTWFPNDKGLSSDFLDDWCAVFEMSHLEDALYDDVIVFSREADQALARANRIL